MIDHGCLAICLRASKCGRICPWLMKSAGTVQEVYCVNLETNEKVRLYDALKDEAFKCPRGLF